MSYLRLIGGLAPGGEIGSLRWEFVVEGPDWLTSHDRPLVKAVERQVNRTRLVANVDPWAKWYAFGMGEESREEGRRVLRWSVRSGRRGIVGQATLVWPKAEDLEGEA